MIEIRPLTSIGDVRPGSDLVAMLGDALVAAALVPPQVHDILVVTQKIVSKAEGRFIALAEVVPGAEAERLAAVTGKDPRLIEVILSESAAVIRAGPNILITRHRLGHTMANAGIDQSNLGPGRSGSVLLLPSDPDGTAAELRQGLADRFGCAPAVLISDSFGRPWRQGVVNVALGASGLPTLIDRRGERDRDGRLLEVTQVALGDMVATAAGLATGEGAEGIPAALVKGLSWDAPDCPASQLVRPMEQDLFR